MIKHHILFLQKHQSTNLYNENSYEMLLKDASEMSLAQYYENAIRKEQLGKK